MLPQSAWACSCSYWCRSFVTVLWLQLLQYSTKTATWVCLTLLENKELAARYWAVLVGFLRFTLEMLLVMDGCRFDGVSKSAASGRQLFRMLKWLKEFESAMKSHKGKVCSVLLVHSELTGARIAIRGQWLTRVL